MAKVVLAGQVFVVASDLTVEDIKDAMKYAPDALQLKDEEGEPIFCLSYGSYGSLNGNGVCFNAETNDGTGKACITCPIPEGVKNAVDYIVDKVGPIRSKIIEVETKLPELLAGVKADRAAMAEEIEVMA